MHRITCSIKIFTLVFVIFAGSFTASEKIEVKNMMKNIHWYGQDGFKLNLGKTIVYIDPFKIKDGNEKADYILITHEHRDHFSPEDIEKIIKKETKLLSCKAVIELYQGNKEEMKAGETVKFGGISVEAVPAYNVNKKFHTKESGKLGYVISFKGVRIYHAGDTDVIPEMKDIKCDIALLPVSGVYVMTAGEAVEAAKILKPKMAVPMHYGAGVVGSIEDARKLKEGLKDFEIEVIIKEKE